MDINENIQDGFSGDVFDMDMEIENIELNEAPVEEEAAAEVMLAAAQETQRRYGVPDDASEVIAKARVRGGGAVGEMTDEEERIFVRGLLSQEERIKERHPEFDLEREIRANPLLRLMLASGEPLEKALGYGNFDRKLAQVQQETEQSIISRIQSRNLRPQPISKASAGSVRKDFSHMSRDDMLSIDEKLKRGEKVYI